MATLAEEILHLCDSGVGVRVSERGDADHVAKRMVDAGRGMSAEPWETQNIPAPRQCRELEHAVLDGVQNRLLARGHAVLTAFAVADASARYPLGASHQGAICGVSLPQLAFVLKPLRASRQRATRRIPALDISL